MSSGPEKVYHTSEPLGTFAAEGDPQRDFALRRMFQLGFRTKPSICPDSQVSSVLATANIDPRADHYTMSDRETLYSLYSARTIHCTGFLFEAPVASIVFWLVNHELYSIYSQGIWTPCVVIHPETTNQQIIPHTDVQSLLPIVEHRGFLGAL